MNYKYKQQNIKTWMLCFCCRNELRKAEVKSANDTWLIKHGSVFSAWNTVSSSYSGKHFVNEYNFYIATFVEVVYIKLHFSRLTSRSICLAVFVWYRMADWIAIERAWSNEIRIILRWLMFDEEKGRWCSFLGLRSYCLERRNVHVSALDTGFKSDISNQSNRYQTIFPY